MIPGVGAGEGDPWIGVGRPPRRSGPRPIAGTMPPRQRHRVTNWAAYDAALRARGLPAQQGEAAIAVRVLNRMIRVAKPVSVRVA